MKFRGQYSDAKLLHYALGHLGSVINSFLSELSLFKYQSYIKWLPTSSPSHPTSGQKKIPVYFTPQHCTNNSEYVYKYYVRIII